ncbi:SUMF1/EgtB/PvdO family nonheme iron enzyme [Adhaeribacter sp. BT258]|uniref:SUMF1/EgtB/PvdO family nonheme iron enzyme n=1 Tax=Adhaeribacter terrigena TaxID=2793070 RepID=A0ABS1C5X7_9BACT|nr:SUMF1/EgtB/PvdO family nonheme iron enzyme [Adhaeribacter terrigena]MBK0404776.1 SUMF1/EgtB/PvdO family nonheme iron enzyme [Adhaeribacter terrigena]
MRILFVISLLLLSIDILAQNKDTEFLIKNKLTPTGTIHLGEGLFFDEAEVANIHWLEFLYFVKRDSSESYFKTILPDTTVSWPFRKIDILIDDYKIDSTGYTFNTLNYSKHYLRNPIYRFYPVVGISYYQAQQYCLWRSRMVSHSVNQTLKKGEKNFTIQYTYYLPSKEEWLKATDSYIVRRTLDKKTSKVLKKLIKNYDRSTTFYNASIKQNLPIIYNRNILIDATSFIGYIYTNGSNSKGLFNTLGNVSELTSVPRVAFGGSWFNTYEEIISKKFFEYEGPNSLLGFRCACKVEILENSPR